MQRHCHGNARLPDGESGILEVWRTETHFRVATESNSLLWHAEQGILQASDPVLIMINGCCPGARRHAGHTYYDRAEAGRHLAVICTCAAWKVDLIADGDKDATAIVPDASHGDINFSGHNWHY